MKKELYVQRKKEFESIKTQIKELQKKKKKLGLYLCLADFRRKNKENKKKYDNNLQLSK